MKADQLFLRIRRLWLTTTRLGPVRTARYCWERTLGLGPAQKLVVRRAERRNSHRSVTVLAERIPSPFPEGHRVVFHDTIPTVHGEAVWSPTTGWQSTTALGQFHVHYLHWLLPLDPPDRRAWLTRWLTDHAEPDAGTAWSPYVVATRTQALMALVTELDEADQLDDQITASLRWNREILELREERALGGNHLIRNLQALVALDAYFGDGKSAANAQRFVDQLEDQLFADGVHHERSPSYHGVVLGDARQVSDDLNDQPLVTDRLRQLIDCMQGAWVALQHHDTSLPSFNDSPRLDPHFISWLNATSASASPLSDSGFRVLETSAARMLVDAGPPNPPHLPGHAHAEIGAFELSTPTNGVIVRSVGTSVYEAGDRRDFERSTAAHTTVVVDRQSQTELWSSFRMGRVPKVTRQDREAGLVVSHQGYHDHVLGDPTHTRSFMTCDDGSIHIRDVIAAEAPVHASLSLFTSLCEPALSHQGVQIGSLLFTVSAGQFDVRECLLAAAMGEVETGWEIVIDMGTAANHERSLTVTAVPSTAANIASPESASDG